MTFPVLTALILLPLVGAIATAIINEKRAESVRIVGMVSAVATLGLAVWMLAAFKTHHAGYQFISTHSWSADIGIRWTIGVDGISLFMVVLNALLTPIALLASAKLDDRVKSFTVWILVLDRKSTRLNSSHSQQSRMPSSA